MHIVSKENSTLTLPDTRKWKQEKISKGLVRKVHHEKIKTKGGKQSKRKKSTHTHLLRTRV